MPLTSEDSLNLVLALARRVKTDAGVKLYNQPIGSVIKDDDGKESAGGGDSARVPTPDATHVEDDAPGSRAPSLVRIRSLLSQMKKAAKMGDDSQANLLQKQLREAIAAYSKGKDAQTVIAQLEGMKS